MRNEDGTFAEGNPGRPKGSRNKLSEAFIRTLADSFERDGFETIEQLRRENPAQYVQAIGRLMPKLMELSGPDGEAVPHDVRVTFVRPKD